MNHEKLDSQDRQPQRASGLDAHKVLVLNADYRPFFYFPLSTAHWQQVMFLLVKGMTTGIPRFHAVEYYDDQFVPCGTNNSGEQTRIQLPSVIAHMQYLKPPARVPLTNENLYLRDNFTCQYSGQKCTERQLTRDHVIPASQGGGTTWENIVSAEQKVNELKDNMSVKEFEKRHGYVLKAMPRAPTWGELYEKGKQYPPQYLHETWKDYLHWDTEGEG
jgi:5-methylcytosine-specific restriction endonuclease McrA